MAARIILLTVPPAPANPRWRPHSVRCCLRRFATTRPTNSPTPAFDRPLSLHDGKGAAFFSGFHRSIAAFAEDGLDLLVEHIVEQASWADQLRNLLDPFDTFWVGLHVPLDELQRRERLQGDRALGEAQKHHRTHDHCAYDAEIESLTGRAP